MRANVGVMKVTAKQRRQKRFSDILYEKSIPLKMTFKNVKLITRNKFISDAKKRELYRELMKKEAKKSLVKK